MVEEVINLWQRVILNGGFVDRTIIGDQIIVLIFQNNEG
jgi:hypothetical protein